VYWNILNRTVKTENVTDITVVNLVIKLHKLICSFLMLLEISTVFQ